ncbi:hypothetical protein RHGRI_000799 [Rhododendron griersonianum]|uniref:Dynein light chain n=1 Tax=Rhododendron griersonianum TaxID=479676 RepID=A0AAV6LJ40_9ERIC|nr:hypothetical protein RHGRI_000799 [Rhododendron griersonianum]
MLEGKGLVKETDMAVKMQIEAMACASEALALYDVSDCISISAHIKKLRWNGDCGGGGGGVMVAVSGGGVMVVAAVE